LNLSTVASAALCDTVTHTVQSFSFELSSMFLFYTYKRIISPYARQQSVSFLASFFMKIIDARQNYIYIACTELYII